VSCRRCSGAHRARVDGAPRRGASFLLPCNLLLLFQGWRSTEAPQRSAPGAPRGLRVAEAGQLARAGAKPFRGARVSRCCAAPTARSPTHAVAWQPLAPEAAPGRLFGTKLRQLYRTGRTGWNALTGQPAEHENGKRGQHAQAAISSMKPARTVVLHHVRVQALLLTLLLAERVRLVEWLSSYPTVFAPRSAAGGPCGAHAEVLTRAGCHPVVCGRASFRLASDGSIWSSEARRRLLRRSASRGRCSRRRRHRIRAQPGASQPGSSDVVL
jgi:hypothetical protein